MLNEKFKPPYTTNKRLPQNLIWNKFRLMLRFERTCLKQEDKAPFAPNNVLNLFIVYELDGWSQDANTDFTLKDCFFWAVKITKNVDSDQYVYISCGIGFDSRLDFLLPDGSMGEMS